MKTLKSEAWAFYKSLRRKKLYCPAFQQVVIVSLLGWNHITKPQGHSRNPADLVRRFKLLKHAEEIISKSTTMQDIRNDGGKTYYILEAIIMDDNNTIVMPRKIRVVIVETKSGKTFLSVMDKKSKM